MKLNSISIDELLSSPQLDILEVFSKLVNCKEQQQQLFSLFESKDATFNPNLRWLSVQIAPLEERKEGRSIKMTEKEVKEFFSAFVQVSKTRAMSQSEFLIEVESPVHAHLIKLAFDGLSVEKLRIRFELESACDFEEKTDKKRNSEYQSSLKFPPVDNPDSFRQAFPQVEEAKAIEKRNFQGRKMSHQEEMRSLGHNSSDCSKPVRRAVKWSEDTEHPKLFKIESETIHSINHINYLPCIKYEEEEVINSQSALQNKYTCRYDIAIEHSNAFPIAKKIIGSNGCNMKEILELSRTNSKGNEEDVDAIKLRLRGKGSGFKEGHERRESDDALHLCVSAKNEHAFEIACLNVEKLLQKIYDDYISHLRRKGNSQALSNNKEFLESLKFTKHALNH